MLTITRRVLLTISVLTLSLVTFVSYGFAEDEGINNKTYKNAGYSRDVRKGLYVKQTPRFEADGKTIMVDSNGQIVWDSSYKTEEQYKKDERDWLRASKGYTDADFALLDRGLINDLFTEVEKILSSPSFATSIKEFARKIFFILAVIEIALAFGIEFQHGDGNLQTFTALLARQTIVLTFFWFLIGQAPSFFSSLKDGLISLANKCVPSGLSLKAVDLQGFYDTGLQIISGIWQAINDNTKEWEFLSTTLCCLIPFLIIFVTFTFICFKYLLMTLEYMVICTMSMFFVGLAGVKFTRDITIHALRGALGYAVKIFILVILGAIVQGMGEDWLNIINKLIGDDIITLSYRIAGACFVFTGLIQFLPDYFSGFFGPGSGGGASIGAMGAAFGAALGARAGVMGVVHAVKAPVSTVVGGGLKNLANVKAHNSGEQSVFQSGMSHATHQFKSAFSSGSNGGDATQTANRMSPGANSHQGQGDGDTKTT